MKSGENNPKRICSFYVSKWHLATMLLPYLNKKLEREEKFITILEEDMKQSINILLSKMSLGKITKQRIEQINWNRNTVHTKYTQIENMINKNIEEETKLNILISGKKEYITEVNKNINNWIQKNQLKPNKINITIINCYEVMQFNDNITEVLNQHDKILNTSGEMEIEEVFNGYTKENKVV